MKTMKKVRNTDFKDMRVKEYLKEEIPDINFDLIFKQKKVDKKEGDDMM